MPSQSTLLDHFHTIGADSHQDLAFTGQALDSPETFFDLPPESFLVPEVYEQDWFNSIAVMQRKSSMKLSFTGGNSYSNQHPKSFSHRFSTSLNNKSSPSLIGHFKTQISSPTDGSFRRNKAGNARLFRSRSEPGGKVVLEVSEPGSPRVSCMGRVETKAGKVKRIGFWSNFKSVLRTRFGAKLASSKGGRSSA